MSGGHIKRWNALRRGQVPFVAQLTPTDCGAASLSAALAYHGKEVAPNVVRGLLGGGRNGVNAKQIVLAAREMGMTARGVRITPDKLQYLAPGSILHWDLSHFVVFERLSKKGVVTLMDPAIGRREASLEEVSQSLSGVAIAMEPGQEFKPEKRSNVNRWKRYKTWLFGSRRLWMRILVTSFFLQLLALSIPGLTSVLIDKVVPRSDSQLLTLMACSFITLGSFYFLSNFLRSRLLLQLRSKVEAGMSFGFVEHLLSLPYAFFQQRSAGDVMMRMSSQARIRELLTTGALSTLLDGVMVCIYLVLLSVAAPTLAAIALVLAVLQGTTYAIAGRRNRRLVEEGLASQARLESYQVEMLGGIESLKSMGATDRAVQRWGDLYVDALNRSIVRGELDGTFSALVTSLRFAGPLTLMVAGAFQVLAGELTLGTMMGLSALGVGFLDPITKLVNTGMKLTQLKGYMERIEDVLDAEPERTSGAGRGGSKLQLRGGIRVENVTFRYPSEPRPALDGVSFEVQPGECVAVVGASGSGKSTLARTLAGLYEPAEGAVYYDDREARTLNLRALRDRLGVVTQDVRLFSGSIRDNVTMFDSDIPQDAVELACKAAALHRDIEQMPMGYDTMLADGGSSVSGGQRQRLALARALVRGPSILILDEATSALDTVTEARVQECLRRLRCTRVIVAHRLSTVQEADKIVVMEAGKVASVGTHVELLQQSEAYQRFIYAQVEAKGSGDVPILRPRPSQPAAASPSTPAAGPQGAATLPGGMQPAASAHGAGVSQATASRSAVVAQPAVAVQQSAAAQTETMRQPFAVQQPTARPAQAPQPASVPAPASAPAPASSEGDGQVDAQRLAARQAAARKATAKQRAAQRALAKQVATKGTSTPRAAAQPSAGPQRSQAKGQPAAATQPAMVKPSAAAQQAVPAGKQAAAPQRERGPAQAPSSSQASAQRVEDEAAAAREIAAQQARDAAEQYAARRKARETAARESAAGKAPPPQHGSTIPWPAPAATAAARPARAENEAPAEAGRQDSQSKDPRAPMAPEPTRKSAAATAMLREVRARTRAQHGAGRTHPRRKPE